MSEFTGILQSIDDGNPAAADELLALVYDDLRRIAAPIGAVVAGTDLAADGPGP